MGTLRSVAARWPLRLGSTIVLVIVLAAVVAGAWITRSIVHDQERRLLRERTAEVGLVLTQSINNIPATLNAQGGILTATNGSKAAYTRAATTTVTAGPGELSFGWLRREPNGNFRVLAAAGAGLHRGEVISDDRTRTFDRATHSADFVATGVFGSNRTLGFAVGPPTAPPGTILYRESVLGPIKPPRAAGTAPFAEVDVVVYGTPRPVAAAALTSTSHEIPLRGDVDSQPLAAGASPWLITVKARRPLVGSVASNAIWGVLVGGGIGALLIAAVIESAARRRDSALALYATEHRVSETLQRSLLAELPSVPGLQLAARYLAAGEGQEVGGDWYDAFPLDDGRVGIVVGDVMGHDLAATSAMAQIRAALRAYAVDGDPPGVVMNRLDHLVAALDLTQLVTVVYGVIGQPDEDGSREICYANAGHLSPLLRGAAGAVTTLDDGHSVVIGAPLDSTHTDAVHRLEPGSTLVLFTDGLVEAPGRPIEAAIDQVAQSLTGIDAGPDVEAVCEAILGRAPVVRRDDIVLLAVHVSA